MVKEALSDLSLNERVARWRVREEEAVNEADRLRNALEIRGLRRAQNMAAINAKLITDPTDSDGAVVLSPRKRARLEHELDLLRTYNTRHPLGEGAVTLHIWIKYGLHYPTVMRQRAT